MILLPITKGSKPKQLQIRQEISSNWTTIKCNMNHIIRPLKITEKITQQIPSIPAYQWLFGLGLTMWLRWEDKRIKIKVICLKF